MGEAGADRIGLTPGRAAAAADEDGAPQPRDDAHHWPFTHLRLRDEAGFDGAAEHEDIEPGGVVGQEQHAPAARLLAHNLDADADEVAEHPVVNAREGHLRPAGQQQKQRLDGHGNQRPDHCQRDAPDRPNPAAERPRFHHIAPERTAQPGAEAKGFPAPPGNRVAGICWQGHVHGMIG